MPLYTDNTDSSGGCMSKYNGCYVRLADNVTYWAVDNGKRKVMANIDEVYAYGLRPVKVVTEAELKNIKIDSNLPKTKAEKKE